jgi:hypothetical protein
VEGVTTLKQLWERNDYVISFDLKEAYNHVPVHELLCPLLGVAWNGKLYQFVGMSFSFNDVFSMIMRLVTKTIRELWSIKAVVYLDDLILLHQDCNHLKNVGKEVAQFLAWLGWTVNLEKSHLNPLMTWKYLSWEWNSKTLSVCLPLTRSEKEKSVRFIKRSMEKDSSTKMDDKSCSSKVDWSIVCRLTPISASKFIPGEDKPDENHIVEVIRLEQEVPNQRQCDGRDKAVDLIDKEESTSTSLEIESTIGHHKNRCDGGQHFHLLNIPKTSIVYFPFESTTLHFVSSNPNQQQNQ